MTSANGEGMELKKYEELLFPNFDTIEPERGMRYVKEFQYIQGDIILCTYPKTGTHWTGNILWKLKSLDISKRPRDTILEIGSPGVFDNQEHPRIMITHLKPNRLYPSHIENKGKIVLLLRNPKDVAVSYFYYLRNSVLFQNKQTWDEYFQSFVQGEINMGSYFTYLREWENVLKEISEGNSNLQVEVFYYEDMLLRPKENIVRLNQYLEFNRDEEYLERVFNETSLGALREQYNGVTKMLTNVSCYDDKGNSVIFRKGQVGDWKTHLTVAQSKTIDKLLGETLQHGLIKFRYEI